MTYREAYTYIRSRLEDAGIESVVFETRCILEELLGITRLTLAATPDKQLTTAEQDTIKAAVENRANGTPLQYIIGKWTFMDRDFFVGEGVLIPRDDTEVAVRACLDNIPEQCSGNIIDLCSGSGIIAVTIACERKNTNVTALELQDRAFEYLQKNIALNGADNASAVQGDIFTAFENYPDGFFDLIVSNPPYIETDVIPTLQKEVQREPKEALDGGADGLEFYRCIAGHWLRKLKSGGLIVLEIGETQAQEVSQLLEDNKVCDINIIKDIQGLDRVVFGTRK